MKQGNDLFNRLKIDSSHYSHKQRILARFILKHYQRVAFTTIQEFASLVGVSEATIVRFGRALGFSGYPDFQREVRRILRADLRGNERFEMAYQFQTEKVTPLSKIIHKEIENLSYLQKNFDEKEFNKVVDAIRNAKEILVVGTRSTASLAYHFWFVLNKLEIKALRITEITTETYGYLNRLDQKALLMVIGFPRYLRELKDILAFSKDKGIKTVTITDSPFSSLMGDLNLFSPAESASFMAFHCAPLVLLNSILHQLSLLDKEKTSRALQRFEILAEDKKYFDRAKPITNSLGGVRNSKTFLKN